MKSAWHGFRNFSFASTGRGPVSRQFDQVPRTKTEERVQLTEVLPWSEVASPLYVQVNIDSKLLAYNANFSEIRAYT